MVSVNEKGTKKFMFIKKRREMERTALRENWPNIMYWFHWSGKFPFCSLNCHPSLRPTPPGTPPQRAARSWRRWGGWYWGEETHDFSDYPFRGESGDFENWCLWQEYLTLQVPIVTNINFLLTISICYQEKWLWELIKWSPKKKFFDLLPNSLNYFLRKCMEVSIENLYVDIGA